MLHDWLSVAALVAATVLALVAARRVVALNRVADEKGLLRLTVFFAALAVAFGFEAIGAAAFLLQDPATMGDRFGSLDLFFWLRHVSWLVALAYAVAAFERRPDIKGRHDTSAPVLAGWLLLAHPVWLLIQAVILFYLMVRTAWNHLRRTNIGSLEVALGFALLAGSRLVPFVVDVDGPNPLGAPHLLVSVMMLAGTTLLMSILPRPAKGVGAGG